MKEMQLDDKVYRPGMVQGRISNAKNALITYKAYEQNKELVQHDIDSKVPLLREIYKRYQNRCQQAGAMDFDDLLLQTNILFRDHPDVLEKYRSFFQFVLVDEYQDTNFAQHLIVQRLCEVHRRICVVEMMRKVSILSGEPISIISCNSRTSIRVAVFSNWNEIIVRRRIS